MWGPVLIRNLPLSREYANLTGKTGVLAIEGNADVGFAGGGATAVEGAGIYGDGGDNSCVRDRGDDGDLYAGSSGDAEVSFCDAAGRALADWRQGALLQHGWVHARRRGGFLLVLLGSLPELSPEHA